MVDDLYVGPKEHVAHTLATMTYVARSVRIGITRIHTSIHHTRMCVKRIVHNTTTHIVHIQRTLSLYTLHTQANSKIPTHSRTRTHYEVAVEVAALACRQVNVFMLTNRRLSETTT